MSDRPDQKAGVLNGVRVLDFTWKTVGPWAPRLLTHFGAEVIHVERADSWDDHRYMLQRSTSVSGPVKEFSSGQTTGPYRDFRTADEDVGLYFADPYFSTLHSGKLAISLNARHPEGSEVLQKLVAISDAVVENFSTEVLKNWGLTWEVMHELNPRLVYMSTSGFGHSGRWTKYRTYGPTAAAQAGLTLTSGLPDAEPAGWGYSHLDVMGGWMGGLALIQGLLHAKKTGRGFHIDYAVTEGAMSLLGPYMLDYQVNGRSTRRPGFPPGNHAIFPAVAPHNTYRCAGRDRVGQDWWVFIACETQRQFESLCRLMRQPELVQDARFATNEARVAHQDELDAIVAKWTRPRRRYEIMEHCQREGIIAAVVQGAEERVEYDAQLHHRGLFPVIDHPELGEFEYESYPAKLSRTPADLDGRGPTLREHNRYVYGELLRLSDAEIASLEERGVI